jgi:hypothetical protein
MSTSKKPPAADRSHGGPGSSAQNAAAPKNDRRPGPVPDAPTNTRHSRVSGGGGEYDSHHAHDPSDKGKGRIKASGR